MRHFPLFSIRTEFDERKFSGKDPVRRNAAKPYCTGLKKASRIASWHDI
jgi:hypothetical protein